MDPYTNPYRPGAGTRPPVLTGRDQVVSNAAITLKRALNLRPSKSLMPIGLRGVGKTVLLNQFSDEAKALGMEVCSIESPEGGDLRQLLSVRLRQTLYAFDYAANAKQKITRAVNKALGVLKSFSLTTPEGSRISLDLDAIKGLGDSGTLQEDLRDVLVEVGNAAREVESGFLLAVDEIQYLSEEEFAALIMAIHRTTQLDLPVVLVGTGLPSVPGKAGKAKSYAERLFDFPEIGSLSAGDVRAAIEVPAEKHNVHFDDDALDEIIRITEGYPYFIQEWAFHAWNVAKTTPITLNDVRTASKQVQEALDSSFFRVRLDRLTGTEKRYLKAMANLGPGLHKSAEIAKKYGARMESVSPIRSALINKGMIYGPDRGQTAFTVPLFDDFLRRQLAD